nr:MAG TPA: hypothetical protein [Caudoviricetes sp.]
MFGFVIIIFSSSCRHNRRNSFSSRIHNHLICNTSVIILWVILVTHRFNLLLCKVAWFEYTVRNLCEIFECIHLRWG